MQAQGGAGPPAPARGVPLLAEQAAERSSRWVTVLTCTWSARRPAPRPPPAEVGLQGLRPGRCPAGVVLEHRADGRPTKPRTSRPSPMSRPTKPSSAGARRASPVRPSATRVVGAARRLRVAAAAGRPSRGPGPPAPTVTGDAGGGGARGHRARRGAGLAVGQAAAHAPSRARGQAAAVAAAWPPPQARPGRRCARPTARTTTACGRSRSPPSRRARSRSPSGSRTGGPSSSSSSSPRTRFSASAAVRRNSSSSAVTSAARSRIRWSASDSASLPVQHQTAEQLVAAVTAAVHQVAVRARCARRAREAPSRAPRSAAGGAERPRRPVVASSAGRPRPGRRAAAQQLGHRRGDVFDPAAAQHHGRRSGRAPRPPARPRGVRAELAGWPADSSSSAVRVSSRSRALSIATAACAASEPSSATSSGSNGRSVRLAANRTPMTRRPSISGTPRIATSPPPRHAVVDVAGVLEPLVGEVVVARVGRRGLRDQAAETGAHRQPQPPEAADTEPSVTRM